MRAVTRGGALAMLLAGALVALPSAASARTIDLPKRASVVLAGEHRDDLTGSSVGSAGDVNGDGRAGRDRRRAVGRSIRPPGRGIGPRRVRGRAARTRPARQAGRARLPDRRRDRAACRTAASILAGRR